MNIILSSDNNYAPYLGVAIYSILKSNHQKQKENGSEITIYVMDMNISEKNRSEITAIGDKYDSKIIYIDTKAIHEYLEKTIKLNVRSLATYYRLFLPKLLPQSVDKVIYMDCDSYIDGDLFELWNIDVEGYDIAGVLDVISEFNKTAVGLKPDDDYVNAGMLVINLKQWREDNLEGQMLDFIAKYEGKVTYHDQGTINGVCLKKKIIHPKFNAMTPVACMKYEHLLDYFNISSYYDKATFLEAQKNPVFVHLVPFLTDRPWIKGNFHPMKNEYLQLMSETVWDGSIVNTPSKVLEPWVKKMFKLLPYPLFIATLRTLRSLKVKTWLRNLVKKSSN